MKICLVNPTKTPRSGVFDLGHHLSENGHEVAILYPSNGQTLRANEDIETVPFPAHFLPRIEYTIPSFRKEYKMILKLIKEKGCDIIQVCGYDYLTSLPPVFIKRKINMPIILTSDGFPGVSWSFGNLLVDSIAKLYTNTLGKFILSSYDELVVLSNKLTEDAINLGVPEEKVRAIPIGVDFDQFNPHVDGSDLKIKLHIKEDEKVLLFVGRLALVKRIDILIDLTKRLLSDGFKIKTIIVGDGAYSDYYEKLAKPIEENILFVGLVPKQEIHEYFAISDVLILPSLSEGLPNVLLEASACGKPIVATNTGGISDIVIHGETGFLAESNNVDSFAHYVKLLLNDEDLSTELGRNAYEHTKEKFNWADITKEYESVYEKVGCDG